MVKCDSLTSVVLQEVLDFLFLNVSASAVTDISINFETLRHEFQPLMNESSIQTTMLCTQCVQIYTVSHTIPTDTLHCTFLGLPQKQNYARTADIGAHTIP